MLRCLEEVKVEGVLTNKEILMNILKVPSFLKSDYTTAFLTLCMRQLSNLCFFKK